MCRTALGMPVVPELNTSTASEDGSSTWVGPVSAASIGSSRCRIGITSASTGWSPTANAGLVSVSAWRTSRCFQAGLSNTAAAPSRQRARNATTNSGRFDDITATR